MLVATWALTGITFLLVVVTFFYVRATWGLVQHTKRAADAAVQAGAHAEASAKATELSVGAQVRMAAAAEGAVPTTRRFVARALAAEIEALMDRYVDVIGQWFDDAERRQQLPPVAMVVTQDYFTVFNANANWLGSIGEGVEHVVRLYVLAKAHVEGHRIWHYLLSSGAPTEEKWRYFRKLREERKTMLGTAQKALAVLRAAGQDGGTELPQDDIGRQRS